MVNFLKFSFNEKLLKSVVTPGLGFSVALLKFGGVDGIGDQLIQNGYSLLSPLVGCLFYIDYQKSYIV